MNKWKTILVFVLVFVFGFFTGKNINRTIESYKSFKRWDDILKMMQSYQQQEDTKEILKYYSPK